MSIFETLDYKEFLKNWVEARPGGGRGEYRRMAEALNVSTTLISQVVNGDKDFSLELANDLCEHLGLSDREADHFLLLIEYARAGTQSYRQRLKRKVDAARATAMKLTERMAKDRDFTEAESAVYYSNWVYTATTHLVAVDPKITIDTLADRLRLTRAAMSRVMDFLLQSGILMKRGSSLEVVAKTTHVGPDSPFVVKHHQNWRLQGFNRMSFVSDQELFFTAPMSLSEETAEIIRQELPKFIEKIDAWVGPSPSETVRVLNIDWFKY